MHGLFASRAFTEPFSDPTARSISNMNSSSGSSSTGGFFSKGSPSAAKRTVLAFTSSDDQSCQVAKVDAKENASVPGSSAVPTSPSSVYASQGSMASDNSPSPTMTAYSAAAVRRALQAQPLSPPASSAAVPRPSPPPSPTVPAATSKSLISAVKDDAEIISASSGSASNETPVSPMQTVAPRSRSIQSEGQVTPAPYSTSQQSSSTRPIYNGSTNSSTMGAAAAAASRILFRGNSSLQILEARDLEGPLLQLGGGARKKSCFEKFDNWVKGGRSTKLHLLRDISPCNVTLHIHTNIHASLSYIHTYIHTYIHIAICPAVYVTATGPKTADSQIEVGDEVIAVNGRPVVGQSRDAVAKVFLESPVSNMVYN